MLEIAVELAAHDPFYEDMAMKFTDHLLWIARALNQWGPKECGMRKMVFTTTFFACPTAARSGQGSLDGGPAALCATIVIEPWQRERVPGMLKFS